jgi:hypothetical protein
MTAQSRLMSDIGSKYVINERLIPILFRVTLEPLKDFCIDPDTNPAPSLDFA